MFYYANMDREALRVWRRRQGLTQRQLAEMLGVSNMAVAYWEWGKRSIPALLPLALEALENRLKGG
jgi:transcriptional regulator with XRE-family HTH domain